MKAHCIICKKEKRDCRPINRVYPDQKFAWVFRDNKEIHRASINISYWKGLLGQPLCRTCLARERRHSKPIRFDIKSIKKRSQKQVKTR